VKHPRRNGRPGAAEEGQALGAKYSLKNSGSDSYLLRGNGKPYEIKQVGSSRRIRGARFVLGAALAGSSPALPKWNGKEGRARTEPKVELAKNVVI